MEMVVHCHVPAVRSGAGRSVAACLSCCSCGNHAPRPGLWLGLWSEAEGRLELLVPGWVVSGGCHSVCGSAAGSQRSLEHQGLCDRGPGCARYLSSSTRRLTWVKCWAVGSTVHMGMPLCVVLQLRTSCMGALKWFTQAGGGCSQHWRGHFLLLCGSVHN